MRILVPVESNEYYDIKKKEKKKRPDRRIFTQPSKYFSYYKILQYDSIILYHYVLLLEVSKLLRHDQDDKVIIGGQIITKYVNQHSFSHEDGEGLRDHIG